MNWIICYIDLYQIYKNEKDKSGWYFQKPRYRRIIMMRKASVDYNNPGYRCQRDNNEETESQTLIRDESMKELLETSIDIWWNDSENVVITRIVLNIEKWREINC